MFQKLFGGKLAELGFAVVWKGDSFELAGIDRTLIDKFSGRTLHINRIAERRGITDEAAKAELGARTREGKRHDATLPQLRAEWRQRLTDEDRAALALAALRRRHHVSADRHAPASRDDTGIGRDFIRQRQRVATLERADLRQNTPQPLRQGHGR